jgi:hypothetical protein
MSQNFLDDCFSGGHVGQTDLQNMENNFAALKSAFSGATQPSNTVAGMPWFDTTNKVLKSRDSANGAWLGLMHGDTSQKIWVYRNSAMDGWTIDSSVSDVVLGFKGGSTYTAGAKPAGSWTVSGLTNEAENAHTHTGPSHSHTISTSLDMTVSGAFFAAGSDYAAQNHYHTSGASGTGNTSAGTSHNHVISHDATWRAAAAVGTLQYLSL